MTPALLFDYGNTLIAFGPDQQEAQLNAMAEVFTTEGISCDRGKLDAPRREQVMRPYHGNGVENDWMDVCHEAACLFSEDTDGRLARRIQTARQEAFWSSVHLVPETGELLKHVPYERFDPEDGDLPAGGEVDRIINLEALLEGWERG
jgi:FMN phosphatase YigB (HAD superfamily)